MSFSNAIYKNIFTGELYDIFNKSLNSDLIPAQDDVFNLGSSTRRWNTLHIDEIKSSSSPLVDLQTTGSYLTAPVWTNTIFNNGFGRNFNFQTGGSALTYTGPTKFICVNVKAQFLKVSTNTNASIALTKNASPISQCVIYIDTAGGVHNATINKVVLVNPNDILQVAFSCETGSVNLGDYTVNGYTSPAIQLTITEALSY